MRGDRSMAMKQISVIPGSKRASSRATTANLVSALDGHAAKALEVLRATTDEYLLTTNWRLKAGGRVVMDQRRHVVLRDTMNHLAHHRGRLTVYLRLLEVPVLALYGPSADNQAFA
jgi:uncharacterized damage-inducible protein DinB